MDLLSPNPGKNANATLVSEVRRFVRSTLFNTGSAFKAFVVARSKFMLRQLPPPCRHITGPDTHARHGFFHQLINPRLPIFLAKEISC